MIESLFGSETFRYLIVGFAGVFLAHVIRKTFGDASKLGPIGMFVLVGFVAYGVLHQAPWSFYPAFGTFCFVGAAALDV